MIWATWLVNLAFAGAPADPAFRYVQLPSGPLCVQREEFTQEAYRSWTGRDIREQVRAELEAAMQGIGARRPDPSDFLGDNLPVVGITFSDAMEVANAVSLHRGLPAAYEIQPGAPGSVNVIRRRIGVRLPSLREWYDLAEQVKSPPTNKGICRAANLYDASASAKFGYRDRLNGLTCDDGFALLSPPGSFPADSLGLFDIWGGVSEFVEPAEISVGAGPVTRLLSYVFTCGNSYGYPTRVFGPDLCFVVPPETNILELGFRLVYTPEGKNCD